MKYYTVLFAAFVLATCSTAQITQSESTAVRPTEVPVLELQKAPTDTVAQFLIAAAASDFHNHRPPDPARFRNVRLGHFTTPKGGRQYLLSGQFLPAQEGGKAEWTPFATIKTSGYEQMLGAQAATYCQNPSIIWDDMGDLSSALQSRYNMLR